MLERPNILSEGPKTQFAHLFVTMWRENLDLTFYDMLEIVRGPSFRGGRWSQAVENQAYEVYSRLYPSRKMAIKHHQLLKHPGFWAIVHDPTALKLLGVSYWSRWMELFRPEWAPRASNLVLDRPVSDVVNDMVELSVFPSGEAISQFLFHHTAEETLAIVQACRDDIRPLVVTHLQNQMQTNRANIPKRDVHKHMYWCTFAHQLGRCSPLDSFSCSIVQDYAADNDKLADARLYWETIALKSGMLFVARENMSHMIRSVLFPTRLEIRDKYRDEYDCEDEDYVAKADQTLVTFGVKFQDAYVEQEVLDKVLYPMLRQRVSRSEDAMFMLGSITTITARPDSLEWTLGACRLLAATPERTEPFKSDPISYIIQAWFLHVLAWPHAVPCKRPDLRDHHPFGWNPKAFPKADDVLNALHGVVRERHWMEISDFATEWMSGRVFNIYVHTPDTNMPNSPNTPKDFKLNDDDGVSDVHSRGSLEDFCLDDDSAAHKPIVGGDGGNSLLAEFSKKLAMWRALTGERFVPEIPIHAQNEHVLRLWMQG